MAVMATSDGFVAVAVVLVGVVATAVLAVGVGLLASHIAAMVTHVLPAMSRSATAITSVKN